MGAKPPYPMESTTVTGISNTSDEKISLYQTKIMNRGTAYKLNDNADVQGDQFGCLRYELRSMLNQ